MIPWLQPEEAFPPLETALVEPNGLLAAGADLSLPRLQAAYRQGVFPWFNPGDPILWWSPDPRMVLFPSEFKLSRSLRKRLKRPDYSIRVDTAFTQVMQACAAPRDGQRGTWINPGMVNAYAAWHKAGYVHSFETWMQDENGEGEEKLVGGLYGVALGRVFFGESMFSQRTDASKLAFAHLVAELQLRGFELVDCQMSTSHLASLGAREISRQAFSAWLDKLNTPEILLENPPSSWTLRSAPYNSQNGMKFE